MARGVRAHAARSQALERLSPFEGPNPVRDPRAADDRAIKVQVGVRPRIARVFAMGRRHPRASVAKAEAKATA
jgi:hypothetical protein